MRTFRELSDEDFIFIIYKDKTPNQCSYMQLFCGRVKELFREIPQNFKNLHVAKYEDYLRSQVSYEVHCNMNTLLRSLLKIFQTERISVNNTMDVLKTLFKVQYSNHYFK